MINLSIYLLYTPHQTRWAKALQIGNMGGSLVFFSNIDPVPSVPTVNNGTTVTTVSGCTFLTLENQVTFYLKI